MKKNYIYIFTLLITQQTFSVIKNPRTPENHRLHQVAEEIRKQCKEKYKKLTDSEIGEITYYKEDLEYPLGRLKDTTKTKEAPIKIENIFFKKLLNGKFKCIDYANSFVVLFQKKKKPINNNKPKKSGIVTYSKDLHKKNKQ